MKKAIKLVWMVLFALPLISLTACGDDDEPDGGISFKDYSNLLNEDREDIIQKKMKDFTPYYQDLDGIFYSREGNSLGNNIEEVDVYFTFADLDEDPSLVPDEESVYVDVELFDFNSTDVFNYLTNKYGKAESNGPGSYTFTKGNMYVWYDYEDGSYMYVSYVNKKKYDDFKKDSKKDVRRAMKARRAARVR